MVNRTLMLLKEESFDMTDFMLVRENVYSPRNPDLNLLSDSIHIILTLLLHNDIMDTIG